VQGPLEGLGQGLVGVEEFRETLRSYGGTIIEAKRAKLVDNAWSAPGATGCGGFLVELLDPIINAAAGVPAAGGQKHRDPQKQHPRRSSGGGAWKQLGKQPLGKAQDKPQCPVPRGTGR
jgi:hypothetical protein